MSRERSHRRTAKQRMKFSIRKGKMRGKGKPIEMKPKHRAPNPTVRGRRMK